MKNRKIKSIFKWSAFLIYIVALIYFVFFAEMLGRADVPFNYRYNLVPFKEIKRFIIYYRQIGINAVILNLAVKCSGIYAIWIFSAACFGT